MRRLIYILVIFILIGGIALTAYAPDQISTVFIILMELIIFAGVVFGVVPVIQYYRGFERGLENIDRAMEVQTSSTWAVMVQIEEFFHQGTMDNIFREYQEKVQSQRESGQVLCDIEDYINEDILANHSWQSVVMQIPGTLTGLGILGTFIGLIVGIRGIGFSTVNAALSSVQTLLSGIQVAFYTSISGVILSLLFNIMYRIAWNVMMRNMSLFIDEFHKHVIPAIDEQVRYRERREMRKIMELLERLPKNTGFSLAGGGGAAAGSAHTGNEQILMPQILQGLRDKEFVFILQPRYDINSRVLIGGEALVRWKHPKLGMLSPGVFIPVLESNGYITRLDQYIWEAVCATIRRWIDAGQRPVPLSVNVTKTDILAMEVADFFIDMVKKYRIPPRSLDIEIAENAYLQSGHAVIETEEKLRHNGFRVIMDGFDGNYIAINSIENFGADSLKLDLRRFSGSQNQAALADVFDQARKLQYGLSVEGIENMEQLGMLRKCGCSEGQGFFLSKPVLLEEFESMMIGEKRS